MSRTWAMRTVFVCAGLLIAMLALRRHIIEVIEYDEWAYALLYDGWGFVLVSSAGLYALYRLSISRHA